MICSRDGVDKMVSESYEYIDYDNKMREWIQKRKDSGMTQKELADKHYFRKHGPNAYYGQKD